VAYVMLDLSARQKDIRAYVQALEAWILAALARFAVDGVVREGRVGVWIERHSPGVPAREDKIAAIGVKVRRWVSFHGISLNVEPDLSHFSGIVPCGQTAHGVTSLADLGLTCSLEDADDALRSAFTGVFGPVTPAEPPV
jgi:lipoyl(octanoyl) transferase